ncbi:MAG: T9SS type A sorting domain-containing protein, partial [Flavobacteriaceae bacterium]
SDNYGKNSQWVVTDESGKKILGLPPTPEDVDFDGAGVGTCLIWHLSYANGLKGLVKDGYIADLEGCYNLSSNYIKVVRTAKSTSGKIAALLYPLPAISILNIALEGVDSSTLKFALFDLGGNNITTRIDRLSSEQLSFNVESLPSGMYLLRLSTGKGTVLTKKVIIQ